jgi:hypothetical protein
VPKLSKPYLVRVKCAMLIANILKQHLKNVKGRGNFEYETIVELATYVDNIVIRLKAVAREEMPHVDGEFLSAV